MSSRLRCASKPLASKLLASSSILSQVRIEINMRASCLRLERQPRIPVGRCGVGSLYDIYEEMRERNHRMVGNGSGFKPDEGLQVVQTAVPLAISHRRNVTFGRPPVRQQYCAVHYVAYPPRL